ncbi:MAG: hypothetical protein H0X02_07615 [Nitrosomonas sp.]|nr:hypothetical protein [Nitrosomonas sp.]
MNDQLKAAVLIARAAKLQAIVASLDAENSHATSRGYGQRGMAEYLQAIREWELDDLSINHLLLVRGQQS